MNKNKKHWPSVPGVRKDPDYGSGQRFWKAEGAKKVRVIAPGCHTLTTLALATYNCRTLSSEGRLTELEEELTNVKWDIIGLSEVRRKGEEMLELKSGHVFYYKGTENGRTSGVGFIIHRRLKNNIIEIEGISDRVARLSIRLTKRYQLQIIQIYAPTTSYTDEDIEDFYEDVQRAYGKTRHHLKIVMGDFNARIGKQQEGEVSVGKFGYGERNERGQRLVEFAEGENLYFMNSFFQKNPRRKWTWRHPNSGEAELDYILVNKKHVIKDCNVLSKFNAGSDHRMVRCRLHLNVRLERQKLLRKMQKSVSIQKLQANKDTFKLELCNRFDALQDIELEDLNTVSTRITNTIMETAVSIAGSHQNHYTGKISGRTKELMRKRREMKVKKENPKTKVEYAELCKTVRKCVSEDIRKYNNELIRKAIEGNKGLNAAKRQLYNSRKRITSLKTDNGHVLRNLESILKYTEEFYRQLYKEEEEEELDNRSEVEVTDLPTVLEEREELNNENKVEVTQLPTVLEQEVRLAINSMKSGKAPGLDGVTVDILKLADDYIDKLLAKLFTKCLNNKDIPDDWKTAQIILLHKKGAKDNIKNYRPISLLSVMYKIFTRVLCNRLRKSLDEVQPKEQAGFRAGFSTIDHIHTLRQVIERTNEYEIPLCLAFIDYEKAFDTVKFSAVVQALENQDIDPSYIELVKNIYCSATSVIQLHKGSNIIKIGRGVRQGDTISPKLFTAVLEGIFQKLNWDLKGLRINGDYLNHLRFADDIVIVTHDAEELQTMIQELSSQSRMVGLKMNLKKTKVMFNKFATKQDIQCDGATIEEVSHYTYLGQVISLDGSIMDEINHRIKLGWCAFGKNSCIFKSNMPLCLKRKVFDQCILPTLTYGAETWTLTKKAMQRLCTTQRSMERTMLGITRRDRKRNSWIRQQTGVTDIIARIKQLKWQWAGHVARREDNRWTVAVLDWIPRDMKRPRKRPQMRWEDELKAFTGVTWKRSAKNRRYWKILGETYLLQWSDNG